MDLRIVIGADHGGYPLKGPLKELVAGLGHQVVDVGAHTNDPLDDYPDFAKAVAEAIAHGEGDRGIVLCGSGVGAAVVANKVAGVRASVCHDTYSAKQGVEHDDMNVLCLGARIIGDVTAKELVTAFLSGKFLDQEKYRRRLNKVLAIEAAWAGRGRQ
ncbi:MAG: RpiB/LacA/LacB family sugar-phosphate isomerase [SAR202 cluster bacterium]|nr:RpiB/LacA/LacB family sugar-phosphate isomerase [SAR202 cluster bacterium]